LIEVATWQLTAATVPLGLLWLLSAEQGLTWTPGLIGAMAYSAGLCGVPAWALWGLIVKRLPMAGAGLTSLLIPMLGVGWAWLFLHEQPDGTERVGMAVILVALAISSMPPRATQGRDRDRLDSSEGDSLSDRFSR
jgi:drug/metabolite transporter (DMT)-like permease